jgi:hypothetical protein
LVLTAVLCAPVGCAKGTEIAGELSYVTTSLAPDVGTPPDAAANASDNATPPGESGDSPSTPDAPDPAAPTTNPPTTNPPTGEPIDAGLPSDAGADAAR